MKTEEIICNFENGVIETTLSFGHKISKTRANYIQQSMSGEKCRNCRHFIRPNKCEIVQGTIDPEGWCKYFEED